jgi:hypothetical protein
VCICTPWICTTTPNIIAYNYFAHPQKFTLHHLLHLKTASITHIMLHQ